MSENLLSPPPRRLHMVIRPSSGWAALKIRELWQFRDLLLSLAGRDLKVRYKQTVLGVLWVVLQPLLAAGIFAIVFGVVAGMDKGDRPYPYVIISYSGTLAWMIFGGTVLKAGECLLNNSQLVSKVFFPRLVLPLSTVLSTMVDFMVGLPILVLLMAIYHVVPGPQILLLPFWIGLLLLFGLGIALIASALMVTYRDIKYIVPVGVSMLMYASPVGYTADKVPAKVLWFFKANPLTYLIDGFRYALLPDAPAPGWEAVGIATALTLAVFVFGLFSFKRMERRFADVI
ncbi:MAG: ABC transporter permease [Phycisphaerae bacterium]